jgi:hypothetical protein
MIYPQKNRLSQPQRSMLMLNELKVTTMPLVRNDLNKDAPTEHVRIVSQAVYGAMIEIANVPINDKVEIEGLGTLVNPIADEV